MSASLVTMEFRHAREEVLKSLASPNAAEERAHRRLAGHHVRQAICALQETPAQGIDWSDVRPD